MRWKIGHCLMSALMIGALFLAGTAAPASAAVVDGDNGSDPQTTGCSTSGITVATWPLFVQGQQWATVELRYSTSCQTNWIRVTRTGAGRVGSVIKTITRPKTYLPQGGALPYFSQTEVDPASYSTSYGMQVYAPGHMCVVASATLTDGSGVVVAATGDQWVC